MIFLFLNSFCGFFFQSLLIKAAAIRLQSDYISSTYILGFLFLGYSSGCKFIAKKDLNQQKNLLLMMSSLLPLLVIQAAILIEQSPLLLGTLKSILTNSELAGGEQSFYFSLGLTQIFFIGFASGAEMICLYNIFGKDKAKAVIALSYFGALFAGLLASFYSFQQDEYLKHFCAVVTINILTATYFVLRLNNPWKQRALAGLLIVMSSLLIFGTYRQSDFLKAASRAMLYTQEQNFWRWQHDRDPSVISYNSIFQRADLVYFKSPHPYFQLYLNEDFQFDSEAHGLYDKSFLEGALYFKGASVQPRNFLILGGGDGFLADQIRQHLGLASEVTLVELDPMVTQLAQSKWKHLNHSVFSGNTHLIHTDAFRFLREHNKKYDGLFLDFPDPKSFDTAKLYSLEMYQMARSVLNQNGFMVLDFPYNNSLEIITSTLKAAGFTHIVAYGTGNTFIYADCRPPRSDLEDLKQKSPYYVSPLPVFSATNVHTIFKPLLPRTF